jgi:hypothetical protein
VDLSSTELFRIIDSPAGLSDWLESDSSDGAHQVERHFHRIRDAVRALLATQPGSKGAIRIEDWNEWPEAQRQAYAELRELAGWPPRR